MWIKWIATLLLFSLTFPPTPTSSRRILGTIRTLESWMYLTKYAYQTSPGTNVPVHHLGELKISAVFPRNVHLSLLVYFNDVSQQDNRHTLNDFSTAKTWKQVYQSGKDCQWRDRQARRHGNAYDLFEKVSYMSQTGIGDPFRYPNEWVEKTTNSSKDYAWYYAEHSTKVSTRKARFFYVALSNCLPGQKITPYERTSGISSDLRYMVENNELVCSSGGTFCQGPLTPIRFQLDMRQNLIAVSKNVEYQSELSAEEYSQWICCIVLTVLYVPLLIGILLANYYYRTCALRLKCCGHTSSNSSAKTAMHKNRGRLILLILTGTSLLHFIAIVLHLTYYDFIMKGAIEYKDFKDTSTTFGRTPQYPDTLKVAGIFFGALANCLFVLALVLTAKGKSITRAKISPAGKMKIAIYFTIYTALQLVVILWRTYIFDPALVLLEWESPPGILLLCARLFVTLWFVYSNFVTLKKLDHRKRSFYRQFCCIGTAWLVAVPALVVVCVLTISTLHREQSYYIVDNVLMYVGVLLCSLIWSPGIASKIFLNKPTNTSFWGIQRGLTSSYSARNTEDQNRTELLNVAIRHAESLQFKMRCMCDESEDLTALVDKIKMK